MLKVFLFTWLLFPAFVFSQNSPIYKNLVLEGGGVRGLAYAGALEVLEQRNILQNIEQVGGSSAGAIAGLMIALDYNSHEIDSIFDKLKVQQFNDGKDIFGKIIRIKKEYGLFKGDKLEKWLGEIIAHKTGNSNTTFFDLHQLHMQKSSFKDLYCTGTNISRQRLEILSWKTWPSMTLKTAVHISGSIPFYFKPVAIDSLGNEVMPQKDKQNYDFYVDGGMLCNFPISIFDSSLDGNNPLVTENLFYNHETLGLKLERAPQVEAFRKNSTGIAPYEIKNMKDYTGAVMNLMMEKVNRSSPDLSNEKGRTIYISYGEISGRPRKISEEEKILLYHNGVMAANRFFDSPTAQN
ncbi:MAG: patatin-like phospholipase family protein [Ginsengibacter sp.]